MSKYNGLTFDSKVEKYKTELGIIYIKCNRNVDSINCGLFLEYYYTFSFGAYLRLDDEWVCIYESKDFKKEGNMRINLNNFLLDNEKIMENAFKVTGMRL